MSQPSELLLPPSDLIYRVAGTSDADWFVKSGQQSVNDINAALGSAGRSLSDFHRILDFGCGCGRIMLPLSETVPLGKLTGVDIDGEAIGWLAPRVPEASVSVVPHRPPTQFAAETFDLVYCHSVFTHLDKHYQDLWLAELNRITKSGAVLVVSFSGEHAFQVLEDQWRKAGADPTSMRQELLGGGILFISDDQWKDGPFPDFYHSAFHTLDYVKAHWGLYFRVLAHIPQGSLGYQDFVVLERTKPSGGVIEDMNPKFRSKPDVKIPLPPHEFRVLVGPTEDAYYENPTGSPVFPEIPPDLYRAIFDFGSGCGRQARQLMQQKIEPQKYLGVDINKGMVKWCQENLSAADSRFQFLHHDVYNPGLGPDNTKQYTAPFPAGPGEYTLVNAHSVFTHIYEHQTEFYLAEVNRILAPEGVARTTWFFFDRRGYPWLENWQNCLFVNSDDPTNAVIYDFRWFLAAIQRAGLAVRHTVLPGVPGHQWQVFLEKRRPGSVDSFPAEAEAASWMCGAIASRSNPGNPGSGALEAENRELKKKVSMLKGEVDDKSARIAALKNSWSWRITSPIRNLGSLFIRAR
jgi:SAM-dependent methyltransferase